ncbi:S-layer homology domain-containing protein [Bacillus paranthracis]|uniref:S-layer homology domain-containing protein n=1 Tax=Bacillus paranthracis TaxID=2026186 RepID=UPI00187A864B|nr:S-layer homology domain-containing protein [Bacillus paranthracis]MBE7115609.1 S-layer homology domain-containing protein [Bacillus paranthracis]MBE7132250.1 S-layer homology domain-containing protein [Bacillus paranthracis]MBE7151107.1 S-layer homology domain-containing protein [Bacillus paranthracis]MCX3321439.1 S-layer homology domain-containing protein [Bacillus paranthracis]MDK7419917.1 S-layer homology domain-containing protein [Bacillus paranthracis]
MAKTNSYKKVIAGTMTAAMVAGVVSPVAAAGKTFPDVDGHWSKESVYYLVEKGAIAGNDDGTFAPDREITRAEAATMMAKILNLPIEKGAKPSYADSQNHWASAIIAAVEKAGVVQGKGDGTFDPDGKIDRVSMASLLVEAYKLDTKVNGPLETKFDDLKDSWGKDKANILVKLGISVGTGDKWEPNKSVTKAEAAQFIAKTDKQFGTEAAKVESAKAVTTQKVEVKFNKAVEKLTKEDIKVTNKANNDKALVKEVTLSEDKKSATVELYGNLAAKQTYTVDVNKVGKTEVAVGSLEAKTIEMADQTVVAGKATKLQYKVTDENGTEVISPKGIEFVTPANTIDAEGNITLAEGTSTTVKAVYKKDGKVVAESKTVKVSAEGAAVAEISNWTVVPNATDAKFDATDFKQNNKVFENDDAVLKVELKNQFGKTVTELNNVKVEFESLNTEAAVVDKATGKITVLGTGGTVPVKVTVKEVTVKDGKEVIGKELATKTVTVEAFAKKEMKEIKLEKTNVALSTQDVTDLKVKAPVLDQYGKEFAAPVTVKVLDKDGKEVQNKKLVANYENKELVLNAAGQAAGKYTVELTATSGKKEAKATVALELKDPGTFSKFEVRGLEKELDKYVTDENKKNAMTVSVLPVDTNGLVLKGAEKATFELKATDKDGKEIKDLANRVSVSTNDKNVNTITLGAEAKAGDTYTVSISTGDKLIATHSFKVVDTAPAAKGLAVEFTSTSLKEVAPNADLKAALLNILSVDGVPATTAKATVSNVEFVSADTNVVAENGTVSAKGATSIYVKNLTVVKDGKEQKVEFDKAVQVAVSIKEAKPATK